MPRLDFDAVVLVEGGGGIGGVVEEVFGVVKVFSHGSRD